MKPGWALGLCLLAAGGLALRGVRLDNRPMHNDEAVNALRLAPHWQPDPWRYDPDEHHGPTLYYCTRPLLWLSGARDLTQVSEVTLRLLPAVCGTGMILLLGLLADGLGRKATLWAGLLTALSPALVFYSRNYIHEMLLAFFTLLTLAAGWRYLRSGRVGWAALTGAGLGLMFATKETSVLAIGAMGIALAVTVAVEPRWPATPPFGTSRLRAHAAVAASVALAVAVVFLSSFFANWRGPWDSVLTYLPWLRRAGGGSPHIHPWYFYLERLAWFSRPKGPVWSEGAILLLGLVGSVAAFSGRWLGDGDRRLARFLAAYAVTLATVYSAIAYKTPWCLVGFLHGWILVAGIGLTVLWALCRSRGLRTVVATALLAGLAHLGWQAWRASFVRFADWRNPYVYAQTVPDALRLVQQVEALARAHPEGRGVLIKVIAPDSAYWPLPWYLRGFSRVGWWDALPADPYAPLVIVSASLKAALDEASGKRHLMVGLFELRPRVFLELYVEAELWQRYLAASPPR